MQPFAPSGDWNLRPKLCIAADCKKFVNCHVDDIANLEREYEDLKADLRDYQRRKQPERSAFIDDEAEEPDNHQAEDDRYLVLE